MRSLSVLIIGLIISEKSTADIFNVYPISLSAFSALTRHDEICSPHFPNYIGYRLKDSRSLMHWMNCYSEKRADGSSTAPNYVEYEPILTQASLAGDQSTQMLPCLYWRESKWNLQAVNGDAKGFAQLTPSTVGQLKKIFSPEDNNDKRYQQLFVRITNDLNQSKDYDLNNAAEMNVSAMNSVLREQWRQFVTSLQSQQAKLPKNIQKQIRSLNPNKICATDCKDELNSPVWNIGAGAIHFRRLLYLSEAKNYDRGLSSIVVLDYNGNPEKTEAHKYSPDQLLTIALAAYNSGESSPVVRELIKSNPSQWEKLLAKYPETESHGRDIKQCLRADVTEYNSEATCNEQAPSI